MDYCNSVLYGISEVRLRPLQSVSLLLNAAARLIVVKRKFDHITSTGLRDDLHWLPVRYLVYYRLQGAPKSNPIGKIQFYGVVEFFAKFTVLA